MIPLPELVSELALGLGAALFGANAVALLRPYFTNAPSPPSPTRTVINMVIGAVVALVGLAVLLNKG
jgi:hypothetical protein